MDYKKNPSMLYAMLRNALYAKGYSTEIMVNYIPRMHYVSEWWKQLYGESEGKDKKGIFPASVDFSTDLHSLGQFIQDGKRGYPKKLLMRGEKMMSSSHSPRAISISLLRRVRERATYSWPWAKAPRSMSTTTRSSVFPCALWMVSA